eukprot:SAG31_NODE_20625_length_569_cov_1.010638_1_plen_176_part_10
MTAMPPAAGGASDGGRRRPVALPMVLLLTGLELGCLAQDCHRPCHDCGICTSPALNTCILPDFPAGTVAGSCERAAPDSPAVLSTGGPPCSVRCAAGYAQGAEGTYDYTCSPSYPFDPILEQPTPACAACEAGRYNPMPGAAACVACPVGRAAPQAGAASCAPTQEVTVGGADGGG